jgi:hypothetical protein
MASCAQPGGACTDQRAIFDANRPYWPHDLCADLKMEMDRTHEIKVRKFPNLVSLGLRAGKLNENFLNAD